MCDGIAVWAREKYRPETERSPTTLAHEAARARRLADVFEEQVAHPLMQGPPNMAQLVLAVAIETARKRGMGDLTEGRPKTRRVGHPPVRASLYAGYGPAVAPLYPRDGGRDLTPPPAISTCSTLRRRT